MRALFILFSLQLSLAYTSVESLIGKPVSQLYAKGWLCIEKQEHQYRFTPKTLDFCNREVSEITVFTDDKQRITALSFQINEVVNQAFYHRIGLQYGAATHMSVAEDSETETTEITKDSTQTLFTSPSFSAKDVAIEEQPLFMSWKKEDYSLEVLNQYVVGAAVFHFKAR